MPVAPCERNERKPRFMCKPHRESGRGREGRQEGNPNRGTLLHHLETGTAGYQHITLASFRARAHEGPNGLVERVVAPDILAHKLHALARNNPRCGMHAAGAGIDGLHRRQLRDGVVQTRGCYRGTRTNTLQLANRLFRCLGATQAATGSASENAQALQESREPFPGNGYFDVRRLRAVSNFNGSDLIRTLDESFAEGKTNSEVLEIGGSRQHDDVRNAVVHESDRHFLRDLVGRVGHLTAGPTIDVDLGADFQRRLGGHYPARLRGAMARKSSRKCLMALWTGNGVIPPSPHRAPTSMVSHKCSNSARFRSLSMPDMILSITSTPRVEPMRQGVHFPQDSTAQNSMA